MILFGLFLLPLMTVGAATTGDQTPPQYDPKSTVCPGNCLGTYVNEQVAAGFFGTVGSIVCFGTQDSPPLGNLTTCLQGPTCSLSTADTQTYISGLLAFEGCTITSTSVDTTINSASPSTSGSGLGTSFPGGLPSVSGGPPPAESSSKNGGAVGYAPRSGRLLAVGVALSGMLVGTMVA
ncbi:hypothetical protein FB451DRAFT_1376830 [Mycena latifolia]|nr:hypothetical protein FB451DRAFT_1376830 [Mycena latifolia]